MGALDTCAKLPWLQILRVIGACGGCVIIALGLYTIITEHSDIKSVVNDLYRVLFGILICVAEARFIKMLNWFSFLIHFIGLGKDRRKEEREIITSDRSIHICSVYMFQVDSISLSVALLLVVIGGRLL